MQIIALDSHAKEIPMDQPAQERIIQLSAQLERSARLVYDAEKRVRTLVTAMPTGIFVTDEAGVIAAANPKSIDLFRSSAEQMVGQNIRQYFLSSTEQPQQEFFSDNLKETAKPLELTALRTSGDKFACEVQVRPFSSSGMVQFLVVVDDVSERHELERMKKEFVAMVSHDLRTPLSSIQAFLTLIGEGVYEERSAQLKQRAVSMGDEALRLITMINSLLDLDKLEAGQLEMYFDEVACSSLVERSIQSISSLAENRHIKLEILLPAGETKVIADADYIVQVLINLLSNALKFSPANGKVTLVAEATGIDQVTFQVVDQGPGIPEEFLPRLFNRFEQATADDARVRGGSGLGLSIAKAIVEQHGGSIGVDSVRGQGSSFWFVIPRST